LKSAFIGGTIAAGQFRLKLLIQFLYSLGVSFTKDLNSFMK
jgi:hypothetical protein